jgi:Arc/MetJ family transcription regulator
MKRHLVRKGFRLDPDLVARAKKALGATSEAEAVRMAIEMVIAKDAKRRKQRALSKEAALRLVAIGGSVPDFPDIPRRKAEQVQNLIENPPAPNAKLRAAIVAMPKPTK